MYEMLMSDQCACITVYMLQIRMFLVNVLNVH